MQTEKIYILEEPMQNKLLTEYSTDGKTHTDNLQTVTVDLQLTLPTPKLTCGPACYSRKLWDKDVAYNVRIHYCGKNKGYMFMWDKSIAKRGSEEIGSCLLKYTTCINITSYIFRQLSGNLFYLLTMIFPKLRSFKKYIQIFTRQSSEGTS